MDKYGKHGYDREMHYYKAPVENFVPIDELLRKERKQEFLTFEEKQRIKKHSEEQRIKNLKRRK